MRISRPLSYVDNRASRPRPVPLLVITSMYSNILLVVFEFLSLPFAGYARDLGAFNVSKLAIDSRQELEIKFGFGLAS